MIAFAAGAIRYSTRGEGFIEETVEEETQQGCVIRQVEGGSGIFENATGYIVSTFTVGEDATIRTADRPPCVSAGSSPAGMMAADSMRI